jgi:hypothetical protein
MSLTRGHAVITTVQAPTKALRELADATRREGMSLTVIGDRKTPDTAWVDVDGYYPLRAQKRQGFRLAERLPENHYARKNLGYLAAIAQGARAVFDTDDDNAPLPNWRRRRETASARVCRQTGWINAYQYFTQQKIWPRGFPLEEIQAESRTATFPETRHVSAPVQQGIVNGSPDVDAIWRLTIGGEVTFEEQADVLLAAGAWCPFNSQNTWWFPSAFPLLYLPSHVSFRMTDIWRSFIAQRCLWAMGAGLLYFGPTMRQERNPHDLLKDFSEEVPGYLNNNRIRNVLERIELDSGVASLPDNMCRCYRALVTSALIPPEEIDLVELWIEDVCAFLGGA